MRVDGRGIALFNVEGALYAIDDSCPHAGSSLLNGALSGRTVQCRAHGLRFDLARGCMPGTPFRREDVSDGDSLDGRTLLTMPERRVSC